MAKSQDNVKTRTRIPAGSALSCHIDALLQADRQLIAAFWDDAQPDSVNLENIAYWLARSAETAASSEGPAQ